ncbi:MAG TPA: tetratricopeptide repeat protein [Stellaceae bacterium]
MSDRVPIEPTRLMRMLAKSAAVVALTAAVGGCAALPAISAGITALSSIPTIASLPDKISNFFKGSPDTQTETADAAPPPKLLTEADFLRGGDSISARGDFATAAFFYAKAADANPNSLQARMRLANAQMALKDDNDAYTNYQAALVIAPSDPDAAMRLGEIELAHGDAKSALDHFAVAIRGKRSDPKLYNLIGVAFTMQGKYTLARQSFEVGLKIQPDYASLQNNYGMMQLQSGDYKAAVATFTKLVQSPQANERYRTNRALAEIAMGNVSEALLDAPSMDETLLRRTLAHYQQPRQEMIQVAAAGNIQMDVTPRAEATSKDLEDALVAPTLIPEKVPAKVLKNIYDQLPTQPY